MTTVDYIYKKISKITFSMSSPQEAEKNSCAKVITAELYDKEGYPVDGGLMDIRLGVIDPGLRCKTCGGKLKECMGHFGHIELARPVAHVLYAGMVYDFLRSTCRECHRILLDDQESQAALAEIEHFEKTKNVEFIRRKVKEILNRVKLIKKCSHCGLKQTPIKIEKPTSYFEGEKRLTQVEVRAWLEKIPDNDCKLLGLNPAEARPEWGILTNLAIPPVTMRPSITLETGERSEDDLTHKLGDVVRINQRLFENINAGAPEIIVEDLWDLLQYHVTTYYDNTITQIPPARHRSGQALKTLSERVKSKEGRFRHNLAGKRVNFAARTVISPDPKLNFNEVGIPQSVAMELTVPERVNAWNKAWLITLIQRGPKVYPGANYIASPQGKKRRITDETREQILADLSEGYIVERHLIDKDISLFNRQPSLHRMSIMAHQIKVLPGRSFRMNPGTCFPYNADFDGDEMNLHIPQTEEARAEAEIMMQVQMHLMGPKNGLNMIGCVEDSVTGNYLLTRYLQLSQEDAQEILNYIGIDTVRIGKEVVSGKEVASYLFPSSFSFIAAPKDGKEQLKVKDGKIISGYLDSDAIGEGDGELIREFYRSYGPNESMDFLWKIFMLGIAVLRKHGFTTGIADTDLPSQAKAKVNEMLEEAYVEVDKLIVSYHEGTLEQLPGKTLAETLEIRSLELLNKVRNKIGKVAAEFANEMVPTLIMIKSHAKGSLLNFTQMSSCVGQQSLGGRRISRGYVNRTLSHFKQKDLGPEAHGFIKNSFKSGLTPFEYFFHAMTGRDALMDTALRTPKSGYLYRRLANALQDLKVEYDHTVRNSSRTIVQFQYGEDNVDVSRTEGGKIDVKKAIRDVVGA